MFTSWAVHAAGSAWAAIDLPFPLACGCRPRGPSALEVATGCALCLGLTAALASGCFIARGNSGPTLPTCEHCGYDLVGLPRPGTCPECGQHAVGTPLGGPNREVRLRSRAVAQGAGLVVLIVPLVATLAASLHGLTRVIEAAQYEGYMRGLGRLPAKARAYEDDPAAAVMLLALAALVLVLPMLPVTTLGRAVRVGTVAAGMLAALGLAAFGLEWLGEAEYLSYHGLSARVAIVASALSLVERRFMAGDETLRRPPDDHEGTKARGIEAPSSD